jgi:hypothetical protein
MPVAIAAAPMIASYVLFPFASVASGLMPEFSSEVAGTVSRASVMEIEGSDTSLMKSAFTVEFSNIRIKNKDTILFKTYYIVHFINPKSNHPALLG